MFDPVQLRTFLAVADTGSFTRAAARLEISQPTVSQHVRRLEEAAGRRLLDRDTRTVALTDNGMAMAGFARSILAAHDQASAYFTGSAMRGRIRVGSADDLALTQLPRVLREFRDSYPGINLELTVGQSGPLVRRLEGGHLDVVFIRQEPGTDRGRLVRRDRVVWACAPNLQIDVERPVPLIAYQRPSISREQAIRALEEAGRTWRITCTTREVNGVLAAARAGIGVAPFPQSLIPADLVQAPPAFELPQLGDADFVLLDNPLAAREPVEALTSTILGRAETTGLR